MTVRAVEGKKPYTGGKGIEIDENKVISLRLRDENNLIIWDEGDNEIYVDLQLDDEIRPTDAFPVGITTGRVIIDNGWDKTGTLICAKTTSGDNIKIFYSDDGHLYVDHGTGLFTQVYLKPEVDALLSELRTYVDTELAKKQDKLIAGDNIEIAQDGKTISAILPPLNRFLSLWNCSTGMPISFPVSTLPFEYKSGDHFLVETVDSTTNYRPNGTEYDGTASQTLETADVQPGDVYIYDGTTWLLQINHDKNVSFANIAGQPSDNQALAQALNGKQKTLTPRQNIAINLNSEISVDYSWETITISSGSAMLVDTRCKLIPTSNFTLQAPSTVSEGQEYVLRCDNTTAYTMTLGTGFTNPHNVDLTLSANATDQFVFLATPSGDLELQPAQLGAGTGISISNGDINNTGVLSVNGSNGAVTVNDVKIGSTAPTPATAGMMWFNTTNNKLYSYDGSNWNPVDTNTTYSAGPNITINQNNEISATDTTYNAGTGIEIKNGPDYSAMQGPAPDGFHVPLTTEWRAVYNVWTALGGGSSDGTNFGIALKLPFAGFRKNSSADVNRQGSRVNYWSSSRFNANNAYNLSFTSTALSLQYNSNCTYGYSVRCFKDSPVVPTSNWTKLYGTSIESGGIFWSSTDGLISLSSDGSTWITIADKNLGATTVWNSGDTLSEANCGKYYQRGNNYGFPRTGTIANQSTTQVDASNYGPGNYYSSDTFIKYSGAWDSTYNGNLWGGVTGVVTLENAITNTGVLSVNGQTGNVTVKEPTVSASAPSNPSQGDQWYDTTNDELKIYDGSAWNSVGGGGGGDVGVSSQANNVFTPGMKIWGGTSANYGNLTPDGNTAYLII